MIFKKKSQHLCKYCNKSIEKKFDFCPYCGKTTKSPEEIQQDFGLLGNTDEQLLQNPMATMGILGQLIGPMMQGIMKSLNEEMQNEPEIQQLPNGISIKIGPKGNKKKESKQAQPSVPNITDDQISRISKLPKTSAKTKIRRFADKVVYDMDAPGIQDIKDILVSKLESGYEVKAIGKTKVYTNSLPVNLPLTQYSFDERGITFEFSLNQGQ